MLKSKKINNISKILVIRFAYLGDIVLLSCLFRELKKLFPSAKIDFITYEEFAGLYKENPHINKTIAFKRKPKLNIFKHSSKTITKEGYDIIIDAQISVMSILIKIANFWRAKRWLKINKYSKERSLLVNKKIDIYKEHISCRQKYLNVLSKICDVTKLNSQTEVHMSKNTFEKAIHKAGIKSGSKYVAVAPGASSKTKRWPLENFAKVCQTIGKDYNILILGGYNDKPAMELSKLLKKDATNLAGKLNLLETCAVIKSCQYSITNDSGALHLSEAVKTPVIAMFGPTAAHQFGFYPHLHNSKALYVDLKCNPCSKSGQKPCKNPNYLECLKSISPDRVIQAAKQMPKLKN